MARASSKVSGINIQDGIIEWFDGPEWDDVAEEQFKISAEQIEEAARQNAIWEDRTGDAKRGLKATVLHEGHVVTLTLAHGVEYGLWLEVIQNGRFAVIMPTLEEEAPRLSYNAIRRIRAARRGKVY